MENNNINNTDVNITEEVQEKKEDLKIIKLKPSQLEFLKSYKTHKKDSYYDLFERLVNNSAFSSFILLNLSSNLPTFQSNQANSLI